VGTAELIAAALLNHKQKRKIVETVEANSQREIKVGPDRVLVSDNELVIDARRPFPDWDVREINQVPVYFQDKKYYLVERRKAEPSFAVRYVLLPWEEDLSTCAKGFHNYDEEAVAAREGQHRGSQQDDLVRAFLMPFYPLMGYLWSGTQRRLTRFGFVPHSLSGVSIFMSFCLVFAQGVFAVVLINTSLRSGKVALGGLIRAMAPGDAIHLGPVRIPVALLDIVLVIALLADVAIRYTEYLKEDEWSGGFLEWLLRRPKRAV
jgi:hypothetical protein